LGKRGEFKWQQEEKQRNLLVEKRGEDNFIFFLFFVL